MWALIHLGISEVIHAPLNNNLFIALIINKPCYTFLTSEKDCPPVALQLNVEKDKAYFSSVLGIFISLASFIWILGMCLEISAYYNLSVCLSIYFERCIRACLVCRKLAFKVWFFLNKKLQIQLNYVLGY